MTANHTSQQVLCQQLLVDQEYSAKIEFNEGSPKLGADGLIRIEQADDQLTKCNFELYEIQAILLENDYHFLLDLQHSRMKNSKTSNFGS